eukprot:3404400-Pyramimonas_sp.AAC.1
MKSSGALAPKYLDTSDRSAGRAAPPKNYSCSVGFLYFIRSLGELRSWEARRATGNDHTHPPTVLRRLRSINVGFLYLIRASGVLWSWDSR